MTVSYFDARQENEMHWEYMEFAVAFSFRPSISGYFCATIEFNSGDRDHVAYKAKNVYSPVLSYKNLLTLH